jgi:hypothetical protein
VKHVEAERLLGGYATGTLTEAERQLLLAAALEHQDIFDALMGEDALKELLADPEAKARLLAALAPAAPKVTPFWRRPGLLGAAASLMVATLAGLAYLRSPGERLPAMQQKAARSAPVQAPEEQKKDLGMPRQEATRLMEAVPQAPSAKALPVPPPPPSALAAPEVAAVQAAPPVQAEAAPPRQDAALKRKAEARERLADMAGRDSLTAPKSLQGGVVGGVAGGAVGGVAAPPAPAPAMAAAVAAKAEDLPSAPPAKDMLPPRWTLAPAADGLTQVTIWATRNAHLVLLKRGTTGVESLKLRLQEDAQGGLLPWRTQVRLAPGEVLDLYFLNHVVADPSRLPETGPVDGFRARIYPAR